MQRSVFWSLLAAALLFSPALAHAQDGEEQNTGDDEAPEGPTCSRGQGIAGVVRDNTGEPVIEAAVEVFRQRESGSPRRVRRVLTGFQGDGNTDIDGGYAVNLPRGTYTIRVSQESAGETVEDLEVERGVCLSQDVDLGALGIIVFEVEADADSTATLIRERREAPEAQDGVSGEDIAAAQDSDAAAATRRIVGATLLDGRYLYIRGLGGRYVQTLLNGAYIPSSDPDLPGVQLDLFPSNVLSSLTVLKTFASRNVGDAAGGTLLIATTNFPAELEVGASISLGFNSETTFQNGVTGPRESLDFLGFSDGTRALPADVPREGILPSGSQGDDIARTFNSQYRLRARRMPPNMSLGFNIGNTTDLGDNRRLGYFLTVGYSNKEQILRGERLNRFALGSGGAFTPVQEGTRDSTENEIQWGALGTLALQIDSDNTIAFTGFWTQFATNYAGEYFVNDFVDGNEFRLQRLRFSERSLYFGQLRGEHEGLPLDMSMEWRLNAAIGRLNEPDIRDTQYFRNEGSTSPYQVDSAAGGNRRLYLTLDQREVSGSLDFNLPISTSSLRFGGMVRSNERDFALRSFEYRESANGVPASIRVLPPEELFTPEQIDTGTGLRIVETTQATGSYSGNEVTYAAYAMADMNIAPWLRVVAGGRIEAFRQVVQSFLVANTDTTPGLSPQDTVGTAVNPLGSLGLVFNLTDSVYGPAQGDGIRPEMYIRANYGTTLARPGLRERANFAFPDFIRNRFVNGNPDLRTSVIHNVDLRWELYPSATEVFAVSAFGKFFDDPIEFILVGDLESQTSRFVNAAGAVLVGGEVEARVGLGNITPELDWIDVGGNVAIIFSEVDLGDNTFSVTNTSRPLAGTSPWIINGNIGFKPPGTELEIRLLYNVFGPRILDVGTNGLPDFYQQPTHTLDVVFNWLFHPNFRLRGRVNNVFYDDQLLTQTNPTDGTDVVVRQFNRGLTGTLGIAWEPE